MEKISCKLSIIFDGQFYIGLFEVTLDNLFKVAKKIFNQEPSDKEVFNFIIQEFQSLEFSPVIKIDNKNNNKINPKRMLKKAKKEISLTDIGTKSQIALKKMQEEKKVTRKIVSKEEKILSKKMNFEKNQQKKLEKHKGH